MIYLITDTDSLCGTLNSRKGYRNIRGEMQTNKKKKNNNCEETSFRSKGNSNL